MTAKSKDLFSLADNDGKLCTAQCVRLTLLINLSTDCFAIMFRRRPIVNKNLFQFGVRLTFVSSVVIFAFVFQQNMNEFSKVIIQQYFSQENNLLFFLFTLKKMLFC